MQLGFWVFEIRPLIRCMCMYVNIRMWLVGSTSLRKVAKGEITAKLFICTRILHLPVFDLSCWQGGKTVRTGSQLFNLLLASVAKGAINIAISSKRRWRFFIIT